MALQLNFINDVHEYDSFSLWISILLARSGEEPMQQSWNFLEFNTAAQRETLTVDMDLKLTIKDSNGTLIGEQAAQLGQQFRASVGEEPVTALGFDPATHKISVLNNRASGAITAELASFRQPFAKATNIAPGEMAKLDFEASFKLGWMAIFDQDMETAPISTTTSFAQYGAPAPSDLLTGIQSADIIISDADQDGLAVPLKFSVVDRVNR